MKLKLLSALMLAMSLIAACGSVDVTPQAQSAALVARVGQTPNDVAGAIASEEIPRPTTEPEEASLTAENLDHVPAVRQPKPGLAAENSEITNDVPTLFTLDADSYLEATIEPCKTVVGSQWDPCDRERFRKHSGWAIYNHPDQIVGHGVPEVTRELIYPPPSTQDYVRFAFEDAVNNSETRLPHIVVRGVYLPGTTRCTTHEQVVVPRSAYSTETVTLNNAPSEPLSREYLGCYVDLEVRENMFGNGPSKLTVYPSSEIDYAFENKAVYESIEFLDGLASTVGEIWEGAEVVLWLSINWRNASVEVWRVRSSWDVRRNENSEVVVGLLGLDNWPSDSSVAPYIDRIEPAIDDYRIDIQQGFTENAEMFGLVLASDANQRHLRDLYASQGFHDLDDVTIVLPPDHTNE